MNSDNLLASYSALDDLAVLRHIIERSGLTWLQSTCTAIFRHHHKRKLQTCHECRETIADYKLIFNSRRGRFYTQYHCHSCISTCITKYIQNEILPIIQNNKLPTDERKKLLMLEILTPKNKETQQLARTALNKVLAENMELVV